MGKPVPEYQTQLERLMGRISSRHYNELIDQHTLDDMLAKDLDRPVRRGEATQLVAVPVAERLRSLPDGKCLSIISARQGNPNDKPSFRTYYGVHSDHRRIGNSLFVVMHEPGADPEALARRVLAHTTWRKKVGDNPWVKSGKTYLRVETFQNLQGELTRVEHRVPLRYMK